MSRKVKLRDFLEQKNVPPSKLLPFVHTTETSKLDEILDRKAIMATPCNVFHGEKLCYLFVGRPAYKYAVSGEASYWMLPTVFVVRFQKPPPFKRIYPFDSGAFTRGRLPDYITTFQREDFEFGPDPGKIERLISVYFGDEKKYWLRQSSADHDFAEKHVLGPLHMQVQALNRLYGDRMSSEFDDRAAAVEVQLDRDLPLDPADILGVVVPNEMLREPSIKADLKAITPNIEGYDQMPCNVSVYFGTIYDAVRRIYQKFGILK